MNHPTKQQVQKVIDTLTKAREMVIGAGYNNCFVDMQEGYVRPCGTPMCHGGYYALTIDTLGEIHDYSDGAQLMAKDLGFSNQYLLQDWADCNPDIWGNTKGYYMFSNDFAFGVLFIEDLQEIIDHWKGVQSRLT